MVLSAVRKITLGLTYRSETGKNLGGAVFHESLEEEKATGSGGKSLYEKERMPKKKKFLWQVVCHFLFAEGSYALGNSRNEYTKA